jgi:hypothetical protein
LAMDGGGYKRETDPSRATPVNWDPDTKMTKGAGSVKYDHSLPEDSTTDSPPLVGGDGGTAGAVPLRRLKKWPTSIAFIIGNEFCERFW